MNTAAAAPATTTPTRSTNDQEVTMNTTATDAAVMIFNVQGQTLEQIARAGYSLADLAATATVDYDDRRDER